MNDPLTYLNEERCDPEDRCQLLNSRPVVIASMRPIFWPTRRLLTRTKEPDELQQQDQAKARNGNQRENRHETPSAKWASNSLVAPIPPKANTRQRA